MERKKFANSKVIMTTVVIIVYVFTLFTGMFLFEQHDVAASDTQDRNVCFKTDGSTEELQYFQSISGGLLYSTGLGYAGANNSRLIGPTGEIIYKFDLADDISSTVLQYASKLLNAKYSIDGVTYSDLTPDYTPENGSNYEVIWRYTLTESNALSGSDNIFYIKFFNISATTDGFIHAVSINSDLKIGADFSADAFAFLPYLTKTKSLIIYFVGEVTPSLYSMAADSEFVFAVTPDQGLVSSVQPTVAGSAASGTVVGYNYDNSATWNTYVPGTKVPVDGTNSTVYFRATYSAGDNYTSSMGVLSYPISFINYVESANNLITNVATNSTVSAFNNSANIVIASGSRLVIKDLNNNIIINETTTIGTGFTVDVISGTTLFKTFKVIIYGDLDSNGIITIGDLAAMKNHLLNSQLLTGANLTAGDIFKNGTGKITIMDLLAVKKHLLSIYTITQS